MALPKSGTIKVSDIKRELEEKGSMNLDSINCRELADKWENPIKFSDFYGKRAPLIILRSVFSFVRSWKHKEYNYLVYGCALYQINDANNFRKKYDLYENQSLLTKTLISSQKTKIEFQFSKEEIKHFYDKDIFAVFNFYKAENNKLKFVKKSQAIVLDKINKTLSINFNSIANEILNNIKANDLFEVMIYVEK